MIIRTNNTLIDNVKTLQRSLAVQRELLNHHRDMYRAARIMVAAANRGEYMRLGRGGWLNECKKSKRALRETCAAVATLLEAIRESRQELLLAMPVERFINTCVRMIEPREVRYVCQNSAFKYGGTI